MSKAYKDPTADRAISEADKWEKRQQELEALHGIKRGDTIWIVVSSYSSGEGKLIQKRVKTTVRALYPYVVQLQLPNGLTRSPYILGTRKIKNCARATRRWYQWTRTSWNNIWR